MLDINHNQYKLIIDSMSLSQAPRTLFWANSCSIVDYCQPFKDIVHPKDPIQVPKGRPFWQFFTTFFLFSFWGVSFSLPLKHFFWRVSVFLTPPRALLRFSLWRKPFLRISTSAYQALLWSYYKRVTLYTLPTSLFFLEKISYNHTKTLFFWLCVPGIN